MLKRIWKPLVAMHFVALGAVLKLVLHYPVTSSGLFAANYFGSGVCSAGVMSVGVCSVGVFSIGVVSFGVCPLGLLAIGIAPTGLLHAIGKYPQVLRPFFRPLKTLFRRPIRSGVSSSKGGVLMERARVNGIELEYEVQGSGEPVVLLHGGLLCDENTPLVREPALTSRYRVINYHRRGFAGSSHPAGKATIADQVADCRALLEHLGVKRAHVTGHSLGGAIAIQLALDAPALVHTLALMEPALMSAIAKAEGAGRPEAAASQQQFLEGMARVEAVYKTGDRRAALNTFLETRAGEAFRGVLDWLLKTGEYDQAVRDADTFLLVEMPAAFAWNFTPQDAARIKQPVLSILGVHSPVRAQKVHEVLKAWVPQTEKLVLPNAEHALALMDPPGIAKALADFFARHPIPS
jgi:pimeloyl-ACP methyl ester carboxylesterase